MIPIKYVTDGISQGLSTRDALLDFTVLTAAAKAVEESAIVWNGFSMLDAKTCIRAALDAIGNGVSRADYEVVLSDQNRLVCELDMALNGTNCAAKHASLADIVTQLKSKATSVEVEQDERPYGWLQFIDGIKTQNFARTEQELAAIESMFEVMGHANAGRKAEYFPLYVHAAPPLSAVAPADLTNEQINEVANTLNWHNARACGIPIRFARLILEKAKASK